MGQICLLRRTARIISSFFIIKKMYRKHFLHYQKRKHCIKEDNILLFFTTNRTARTLFL